MKIDKKNGYTLISSNEKKIADFIANFKEKYNDFKQEHLIIDISSNFSVNNEDFFIFSQCSETHQNNGMTFVIVFQNVDVDDFPGNFNIVPTLNEAEDVLEMENIQRDLGF